MSDYVARGGTGWNSDAFMENALAESGRRMPGLNQTRRAVVLQVLLTEAARLRAARERAEERVRWLNGVLAVFTPRRLGALGVAGAVALLLTGYVLFGGLRTPANASLSGVAAVSERRQGPFGLQWSVARPSSDMQAYTLHRGDEISAVTDVVITFADGSTTTAQPGTRLRLLTDQAGLVLITGEVANSITPSASGAVKFRVESASGAVEVKGTEFRVRTESDVAATAFIDEGRVGVTTSAGGIDVVTGEQARLETGALPIARLQAPLVRFATSAEGRVLSEQPRVPFSTRIFPGANLVVHDIKTRETFATYVADATGWIEDMLPPILGTASLRFSQNDASGRTSALSAPVEIVVDDEAPILGVTRVQPTGGDVWIAGRTERAASVRVNGQAVEVKPDGTFETAVKISAGLSSITIAATDLAGNTTVIVQTLR
jgi:hypothetical protein